MANPQTDTVPMDEEERDAETPRSGFLARGGAVLRRAWRDLARGKDTLSGELKPDLPDGDLDLVRRQVDACLAAKGGQVAARALAADLGRAYLDLSSDGQARFFRLLAHEYATDDSNLRAVVQTFIDARSPSELAEARRDLGAALTSPRLTLLKQFNGLEGGVKFLVDLRADLLGALRGPLRQDPEAIALGEELRELLEAWFDVGFLELRRITWDCGASLLEKLVAYEAVHQIRSWDDLKNRLDSDRRCYAFFHPNMPDEPLIFVEVALVNGIAGNVQELLDEDKPPIDPQSADTAIFYSISNAQSGLAGVGFGEVLIKRVVAKLSHDYPNIKTFATLSPIPGLRRWIEAQLKDGEDLLSPAEETALSQAFDNRFSSEVLTGLFANDEWLDREEQPAFVRPILERLAAKYLLMTRRSSGGELRAVDAVAHFHLSNGARIERLNWAGDRSANGVAQSAGLMVNYLYKLSDIEQNHESYGERGRIHASRAVRSLA